MSNPNNLIRPALLNPNQQNNVGQQNQGNPPLIPFIITPEIETQISNVVRRAYETEQQNRNRVPILVDQGIDEQHNNNLTDLDKIPDIVKCLRDFSGNPTEFGSWKKSVERVLKIYENLKGTPKYFGILNVVRNKITGNADIALESYNTPLNWDCIIKCLTTHYADKRDLGTLEYQMSSMTQGNNSVQDFYKEVYAHLSLILNKIACMEESETAIHLLTKTYRNKALDTFVRGLRGDLPRLLGIREPSDLHEALHLCLKLENQQFRTHYANNTTRMTPPIPQRKANNHNPIRNFYPQLAYLPQIPNYPRLNYNPQNNMRPQVSQFGQRPNAQPAPMNTQRYSNPQMPQNQSLYPIRHNFQPPPRPSQQKPPVPMEVDPSLRSRMVNYMNRPAQNNNRFSGVRPPPQSSQVHQPAKFQRINHIEASNENEVLANKTLSENVELQEENEPDEELTEYLEQYFGQDDDVQENELSDINFLD